MSYPMTQLGGRAFNHGPSNDAEQEYDRLRALARQERDKRSACLDKAHAAYARGDGQAARQFSEEGKRHAELMGLHNKQASDFIFRENNAVGRVDGDTIDLHGQFVEEAEEILERRIGYARGQGQTHLHVIVGKGNHSPAHVQKLKPAVERICRDLGVQYAAEENAGRIYIDLTGGPAQMPPYGHPHYPQQQQEQYYGGGGSGQQQYQQGGGYPGQQHGHQQQQHHPQHEQQGHANAQNAEIEAAVKKFLPRVLRKLEGCCVVM